MRPRVSAPRAQNKKDARNLAKDPGVKLEEELTELEWLEEAAPDEDRRDH